MKYLTIAFLSLIPLLSFSQEEEFDDSFTVIDSLYREDQVYVGVTFNLLSNSPQNFSQNGLSASIQAGFIRDFPINKQRNKAFGIGLGLSVDTFNHNLFISKDLDAKETLYSIISPEMNVSENRFTYYTAEMPIEYRWRTSTPTKYSFWRIHAGVKLGYIFSFGTTFIDDTKTITQNKIQGLNKLQYGPSFSFGYGAFNFQAYYGMNTIFDNTATTNDGENVNLQVLRLGLIFYLL